MLAPPPKKREARTKASSGPDRQRDERPGLTAADAHRVVIEGARQLTLLRAREHRVTVNERESSLMAASPRGLRLRRVESTVRSPT